MPKPFMLGVEIEEVALGNVLRKINAMPGVVKIHMDMKGAQANGHANGAARRPSARNTYAVTGDVALIELLAAAPGKELTLAQLRDGFGAMGRAPGSVNSISNKLKKDGVIVNKAPGVWSLTKKGVAMAVEQRKEKTAAAE